MIPVRSHDASMQSGVHTDFPSMSTTHSFVVLFTNNHDPSSRAWYFFSQVQAIHSSQPCTHAQYVLCFLLPEEQPSPHRPRVIWTRFWSRKATTGSEVRCICSETRPLIEAKEPMIWNSLVHNNIHWIGCRITIPNLSIYSIAWIPCALLHHRAGARFLNDDQSQINKNDWICLPKQFPDTHCLSQLNRSLPSRNVCAEV